MKDKEDLNKVIKQIGYEDRVEGVIGLNDEIEFECQRCGKCCQNRNAPGEEILLSPLDIYNGSIKLGITPKEFVDEYAEVNIGPNSHAVVMCIACDDNGDCKLLEFDENKLAKCKVHDHKPVICAIHPLGIIHSQTTEHEDGEKNFIVATHCQESRVGKMAKASDFIDFVCGTQEDIDAAMHVRVNWLPKEGLKKVNDILMLHSILSVGTCTEEERQEFGVSDNFYNFTKDMVKSFEKHVGPVGNFDHNVKTMTYDAMFPEAIKTANYEFVYINYDLTKPFKEQAYENLEQMKKLMKDVLEFKEERYKEIIANLNKSQIVKIDEYLKYMAFMGQKYRR